MNIEIEKWISDNYKRLYENSCRITSHQDKASDLLHGCLTEFLSYPDEKQVRIFNQNKLENYLTSCCNIQFKSSTSPYHKHHRKQSSVEIIYEDWKHDSADIIDEIDEYEVCVKCILDEVDNLHFYYRTLVTDKYITGLTFQEMHVKYKISKNALLKDCHDGLAILRKKCNIVKQ
jgi:DNA-directed RNA polymerase specialized sigma24 family protein